MSKNDFGGRRCGFKVWKTMGTNFLQPVLRKSDGRICDVLNRRKEQKYDLSSRRLKKTTGEFDEVIFQGVERPRKLIFASWASKKETDEFA
jgi:hypothetical protein